MLDVTQVAETSMASHVLCPLPGTETGKREKHRDKSKQQNNPITMRGLSEKGQCSSADPCLTLVNMAFQSEMEINLMTKAT